MEHVVVGDQFHGIARGLLLGGQLFDDMELRILTRFRGHPLRRFFTRERSLIAGRGALDFLLHVRQGSVGERFVQGFRQFAEDIKIRPRLTFGQYRRGDFLNVT